MVSFPILPFHRAFGGMKLNLHVVGDDRWAATDSDLFHGVTEEQSILSFLDGV